jgi:opacity protein-like surface antigen
MSRKAIVHSFILIGALSSSSALLASPWYFSDGLGTSIGYQAKDSNVALINSPSYPDKYLASGKTQPLIFQVGFGRNFVLPTKMKWFSHYRISINYNFASASTRQGSVMQYSTPTMINYTYRYNEQRNTFLLDYQGDIASFKRWTPHVNIGAGVSFNRSSGYSETPVNADVLPRLNNTFANRTVTSFAYLLGFGASYEVNGHVSLAADYNYLNAGKATLGAITAAAKGPEQVLAYQTVLMSINYRF